MRMFVGFLLLVSFIGEVFADDICSQDLDSSHPCPAGKYYDSDQDECRNCPAGYYCPGTDANPDTGMAYCCNTHTHGMFPNSDVGASNVNSCYTSVSCGNKPSKISCWTFDADGNCEIVPEPGCYEVQITRDEKYPENVVDKKTCALGVYSPDMPNYYHIESIPHYDQPPQSSSAIWYPKSYTFACVPDEKPCKDFFPSDSMPKNCYQYGNENDCTTNTCDWDGYHSKCMLFDQIGAYHNSLHCASAGNITGNATWNDETNTWDISQCKCTDTDLQQNDNRKCYIKGGIHNPITTGDFATVHLTNEHIIFNENITTGEDLPCVKCFEDTNDTKYYVDIFYSNTGFVDKCKGFTNHGSYRNPPQSHQNYCGGLTEWPENLQANPCPKEECPAGKTTTKILPIGANNCKYTAETQFCDAKGCFNLNDIDNWNFWQ